MSDIEFSPSDTCAYFSQSDEYGKDFDLRIEKSDVRWMIDQLAAWAGLTLWPRPIPVSEQTPPNSTVLLAWDARYDGEWKLAKRNSGENLRELHHEYCTPDAIFTHWLPMPPKPE